MPPLYLIDASIYIFQAHFSPHTQDWSTRSEDRSAFVGFARFLLRFLRTTQLRQSASVAVAFDESLQSGFRHRLYADYKSNRVLPDDNLARQLKACVELCTALGVPAFASQEFEADDIIGTLSARWRALATHEVAAVTIVSRDKDLSQLLNEPGDRLWDFYGGIRKNREDIFNHTGIWPEQFPCYIGLTGDSIDCIPGVPGIGPVAARALLQQYKNLDTVLAHIDQVPALKIRGAQRCADLLKAHQQQALLSRTLATIIQQVPMDESFAQVTARDLQPRPPAIEAFESLMSSMEIPTQEVRRLLTQLESINALGEMPAV
ncbi:MAG: 5'-3' exonuclease [Pseudohongiella sp.]|nr:5'-3' exonuclease [Pseudohongiella sp.]